MKVRLEHMTFKEVRGLGDVQVAVLPWGSCEPHGLHLPYATDTLSAVRVAELACERAAADGAKVVLLPAIPVGYNGNQRAFPLTLNLQPTTQLAVLRDIVDSLAWHGIRKLVVLNGHGGNEFRALLRELYPRVECRIFLVDWWERGVEAAAKYGPNSMGHAGPAETSWSLFFHPELVHMEWADTGITHRPRMETFEKGWAWTPRPWHSFTDTSGEGDPGGADAGTGKLIVQEAAGKIARFLVEFSEAKLDDRFPY